MSTDVMQMTVEQLRSEVAVLRAQLDASRAINVDLSEQRLLINTPALLRFMAACRAEPPLDAAEGPQPAMQALPAGYELEATAFENDQVYDPRLAISPDPNDDNSFMFDFNFTIPPLEINHEPMPGHVILELPL